jgi:hypothetical protein
MVEEPYRLSVAELPPGTAVADGAEGGAGSSFLSASTGSADARGTTPGTVDKSAS